MRVKIATAHVDQKFFPLKLLPKHIKDLRTGENNFGRIERPQFPTNPAVWINSEKN